MTRTSTAVLRVRFTAAAISEVFAVEAGADSQLGKSCTASGSVPRRLLGEHEKKNKKVHLKFGKFDKHSPKLNF